MLLARGDEARIVEYRSGDMLLADLEEGYENFDLFFLEGEVGLSTAHRLRRMNNDAPLVLTSASQEFAVEGYEVGAAGYLLKPINPEKLEHLLDRLLRREENRRISLHCGREDQYIHLDEIAWMESHGNTVDLHLTDGTVCRTREKLCNLEQMVDDKRFLRCHQSFLVNMEQIDAVQEHFRMCDGAAIPIRVKTRKQVLAQYHSWFMSVTQKQLCPPRGRSAFGE
jgi:DNA-binding LytR/AlgR family response regulator